MSLPWREIADLRALGELGLVRGIGFKLDEIALGRPASADAVAHLRGLADSCDLPRFLAELDALAGAVTDV